MNNHKSYPQSTKFEFYCYPYGIRQTRPSRENLIMKIIKQRRSHGILDFYFPDPGREYGRWTEKTIPAPMYDIPLYRKPDGKVFDALHFSLKRFAPRKDTMMRLPSGWTLTSGYPPIKDEEYFVVSTLKGSSLRPYRLRHGNESAETHAENIENAILRKDDLNFYKTPIYRLWFRTYGEWKKGWYHIVLDETTGLRAYIRQDDERVCFVSWEEEFCGNNDTVDFHGHKLYDKPKGKRIKIDDSKKTHFSILLREGDWMCVGKGEKYVNEEKRYMNKPLGWLRWRDKNGILPGIKTYHVVY